MKWLSFWQGPIPDWLSDDCNLNNYEQRVDKYFLHLFVSCANKIPDSSDSREKQKSVYRKIVGFDTNWDIPSEVDLLYFLENIKSYLFFNIFTIFIQNKEARILLSWEEVAQLCGKNAYQWFLLYILPKVYKSQIAYIIKTSAQENEFGEYNPPELKPEIKTIVNWKIDIYTFWELKNIKCYLVVNWQVLREFDYFRKDEYLQVLRRIQENDSHTVIDSWDIIIKIGKWNKYAYMYASDWELIWWEFDKVGEIKEWFNWDNVFWAKRWEKRMYINVRTWKPIWWEFDEVGEIKEWFNWDKYFEATSSTQDCEWCLWKGYHSNSIKIKISLKTWKKISWTKKMLLKWKEILQK